MIKVIRVISEIGGDRIENWKLKMKNQVVGWNILRGDAYGMTVRGEWQKNYELSITNGFVSWISVSRTQPPLPPFLSNFVTIGHSDATKHI